MLFVSILSLVWDGSILCRFVEAYSVTQQVYLISIFVLNAHRLSFWCVLACWACSSGMFAYRLTVGRLRFIVRAM